MHISYANYKGGTNNLIVIEGNGITTTGQRSKEKVIQSHKNKLIKKLDSLKIKLSNLEELKYKQQCEEHWKLSNIGWGAAMRGYKCMTIKLDKSSKTQEKIDDIKEQIMFFEKEIADASLQA